MILFKWESARALSQLLKNRIFGLVSAIAIFTGCLSAIPICADVKYGYDLRPGSPAESKAVLIEGASTVTGETRQIPLGGFVIYRLNLPPLIRCAVNIAADALVKVVIQNGEGKIIPYRAETGSSASFTFTSPASDGTTSFIRVKVLSQASAVSIKRISVNVQYPDSTGNGLGDPIATMMGISAGGRLQFSPRPGKPHTSFQTSEGYDPKHALPTDMVLVYSSDIEKIQSWKDHGYQVVTMGGFRENEAYVREHKDETQQDKNNNSITIGGNSFYMVPTTARNQKSASYYVDALKSGATGIAPEEPELFAASGYSDSFKQEWQSKYNELWQPPHTSIDASYKSEKLKQFLTTRQIDTILNAGRDFSTQSTRMVALHSPITYYAWGISVPHKSIVDMAALTDVIAQVWTGTARTPERMAGVRAERTFETAYLEYSSMVNLIYGTGKRLWFLSDPIEDNPNRSIDDYTRNYMQTVVASLMFPQVDNFEVMPWPARVYDKVPSSYATVINTITGVLGDIWTGVGNVDNNAISGTSGIGILISDTMGLERAEPGPSDLDGLFAMSLPFVNHGLPINMVSLDKLGEPGYLNKYKVLLLSYDYLKPSSSAVHKSLSDWVRRGGNLIFLGGRSPFDAVKDSWWKVANLSSPVEDLFSQLGLSVPSRSEPTVKPVSARYSQLMAGDPAEHEQKNRNFYSINVANNIGPDGSVEVKFEDVSPTDGWGATVYSVELRIKGKLMAAFSAGSDLETRFLSEEHNSGFNGKARFADRDAFWTYRFDNLPKGADITLVVDMANGFKMSAAPGRLRSERMTSKDTTLEGVLKNVRLSPVYPMTRYGMPNSTTTPTTNVRSLYTTQSGLTPIWQASIEQGTFLYSSIPAAFYSSTSQSSRLLRGLVRWALENSRNKYTESTRFISDRGSVVAVKALGEDEELSGTFVNLLSPTLAMEEDPTVPARSQGIFMKVGQLSGAPRLLAASGRLRAKSSRPDVTSFMVQATSGTDGVARVYKGKKSFIGVKASNVYGVSVPATAVPDGDTILFRYTNDIEGVIVRAGWK